MDTELLKQILSSLQENNRLLNEILSLFSRYDNAYSEEVIKENHFEV